MLETEEFAQFDEDGEFVAFILSPGGVPAGHTAVPVSDASILVTEECDGSRKVVDLDGYKDHKIEQIKNRRYEVEYGGLNTPFGRVQTDVESQRLIHGSASMASIAIRRGMPFEIQWTLADNTRTDPLNAEQMEDLGLMVGNHTKTCQALQEVLRKQVWDATDKAGVDNVDIDAAPWPLQPLPVDVPDPVGILPI